MSHRQAPPRSDKRPSYLRRIFQLLVAQKRILAGILAASLVLNLMGLVVPWLSQLILDRVVPAGDLGFLARLLLTLALVMVFQIVLTVYRRLALVRLTLGLDRVLLREFCAHLLALPVSFFKAHRTGDLTARFTDQGYVRHLFTGSLTRVLIDSVMVLIYFVVMFQYSVPLTLMVIAVLVLFAGFTLALGPLLKRSHRRLMDDKAAQEAQLTEVITAIELVKAMALEQAVQRRWEALFHNFVWSDFRTKKLRQLLESTSTAIKLLGTLGLLWYGAALVVQGYLTTGELVAFSMYASQAMLPLLSLITLWEEWQQARAALERIEEVLGHKREAPRSTHAPAFMEAFKGHVTFERVSFDYGGQPVLREVSFELYPGEHVAVVGSSGSGKTTLARLLLGLYRPAQGRILIDGHDLASLDLAFFRHQVGVVLQESLLLAGTIRENIAPEEPEPDMDRVREAARVACAHEFIITLSEGYATIIGELGLTLSGGQRQRISLARALYRDPRLLVLDEPTSSLDREREQSIQENLAAALCGRTALIITHSPEVLRHADRILVLEDGVIVEQDCLRQVSTRHGRLA